MYCVVAAVADGYAHGPLYALKRAGTRTHLSSEIRLKRLGYFAQLLKHNSDALAIYQKVIISAQLTHTSLEFCLLTPSTKSRLIRTVLLS